jgi:hypothetical protein
MQRDLRARGQALQRSPTAVHGDLLLAAVRVPDRDGVGVRELHDLPSLVK